MEINKNELKILKLFRKELFLKASILEIMKKINSRAYQRVHEAVKWLVKKKILISDKQESNALLGLNKVEGDFWLYRK